MDNPETLTVLMIAVVNNVVVSQYVTMNESDQYLSAQEFADFMDPAPDQLLLVDINEETKLPEVVRHWFLGKDYV